MTLTTHRPPEAAPPQVGDGADEAFDEAFKALLRTWHDYEVLRAIGAPLEAVFAAHGALQKARGEVSRHRPTPQS